VKRVSNFGRIFVYRLNICKDLFWIQQKQAKNARTYFLGSEVMQEFKKNNL